MTTVCQPPNIKLWRELYKAAVFETDRNKLLKRIAEARMAVPRQKSVGAEINSLSSSHKFSSVPKICYD
jgi:hypothetical protein